MAPYREFRSIPFEHDSLALDNARTAFDWLVTGPAPMSIDGRFFPGLPARRVSLDELRELLLDPHLPMSAVDLVWMHLVGRSRDEGGSWTVACVGVALPALFAIAADLCGKYADDYRDIHAAVLTGFLSELSTVDLARPWVMWRLRCAALRAGHLFVREALDRPIPSDEDFHSSEPTPPWGHPDFVLARAVAEGAITADEAELIGSTRLEDYTLEVAAADTGVSVTALQRARAHAEARLLEWLTEQAAHDESSGEVDRHNVATHALNDAAIRTAAYRIRPVRLSRPVTDVPARFSVTVRYRAGKNRPESGVGGRGRTPAAPAHTTTSLDRPTDITRRLGHDSGDAAMRLTRPPLRRPPRQRTDGRRPRRARGAAPLAATPRVRRTGSRVPRRSVEAPTTPSTSAGSTGRRTTVRRLLVITEVVALALLLSDAAAHAETTHAATTQLLALAGSIDDVLTNIRNWVMGILAGLATVFLSIGGVRYVMGGGDPGEIDKARTAFKAAGIGYALAALAPLVVTVLKGIVGA